MDLFHPSYRVKLVRNTSLSKLSYQSDLYLDIVQCEKAGLVNVEISMDKTKEKDFKVFLEELYLPDRHRQEDWNIMRTEVIRILVEDLLTREIIKEVREEIKEEAENFVISKCKEVYKDLLMTGPFSTNETGLEENAPIKKSRKGE